MKTKLSTLWPNIFLYIGPNESHQSRIRADATDSCEGVYSSGKRSLVYTFPAFEKKIVSERDVLQCLMGAQKKLSLPPRKINPKSQFPTQLYNFLIDGYHKDELGIIHANMTILESLTLSVRDLLQSLHGLVKPKLLPW
jgi:hypothetical protein